MNQVSNWRIGIIAAITLLSVYLVTPSARYLFSLGNEPAADSEQHKTWDEDMEKLRVKAIPLGLDLRGGVDVTLRIDPTKSMESAVQSRILSIRNEISNSKISATVNPTADGRAFTIKLEDQNDKRRVHNILENYKTTLLAVPAEADLASMQEVTVQVDPASLDRRVEEDIKGAEKVVRERLDKMGLAQPSIAIQGKSQIRVQIAGEKNPEKVVNNLTQLAHMEFRLAHPDYNTQNDPIQTLLDEKGEVKPEVAPPLGYEVVDFKFGRVDKETHQIVYRTGKMLVEDHAQFGGENLRSAGVIQDPTSIENPIKVSIQLDPTGTERFGEITKASAQAANSGGRARNFAVLLDGVVRTAPEMKVAIPGGNAVIEGGFTFDEAQDLSHILKAGSLPAPLIVESQRTVTASLGNESIFAGVKALVWGTVAIIVFMVAYYSVAGVIAVLALILNVLMVLGIFAIAGATMTLSGIGGILLTVGMAVDANVLIYERVREEIDGGRPMKQALTVGYDRAFSVIVDSHLTTLLTALILLQFTEGSVFGFALTMTFGIVANLYTGLTVTQTLCRLWFQWRGHLSLGRFRMFKHTAIDFVRLRYASISFSMIVMLAGLGYILVAHHGLRFGVDFSGGLVTEVSFKKPTDENAIRKMIADIHMEGERVQNISGTNNYIIRVKTLDVPAEEAAQEGALKATKDALNKGLETAYGSDGFEVRNSASFGPETGQGFRMMAISVVILASIAIMLFLWFRFEFIFGFAAVAALLHDLFITLFWSQIWGVDITLDVVAALLVLMGFSVNDTIVIFDRIREHVRKGTEKTFKDTCNAAMNQTLSRTIITSGTVVLVVVVMLFVGGEGLKPFAKVLTIGVITGTYSSIFTAAPIVYEWNKRRRGKLVEELEAKGKPIGPEPAKAPKNEFKGTGGNVPKRRAV